jgi:cytochrome c5
MKLLLYAFLLAVFIVWAIQGCYYDNEAYLYKTAACTDTISSYSGRLKNVIEVNCLSCHGAGSSKGDYSTFDLVNADRDNVVCRAADGTSCGNSMPPSGSMNNCDREAFNLWRLNGFRP